MRTPLFSEPLITHGDVIIDMLAGLHISKLVSCDLLNVFIYFTAVNVLLDSVVFGNLLIVTSAISALVSFIFLCMVINEMAKYAHKATMQNETIKLRLRFFFSAISVTSILCFIT